MLALVAVIAFGGYSLLKGNRTNPSNNNSNPESPATATEPTEVIYTQTGYTPETLRVKAGTTVIFKNASPRSMWTASALHPTHRLYDDTALNEHCPDVSGVAFDQCGADEEYSFTFNKTGNWKYHNHLYPEHTGAIIVE